MLTIEDGRQIYLSETDIDLLKTLLQPGAEFDDDGYPENDPAILYQKLSDQRRSNPSALWVSVYEETQQYGGPEEGGWWYTHSELTDGQGFTNPEKLVEYYNQAYQQLCDEYHCLYPLADTDQYALTLDYLERCVAAAYESDYDCDPMCTARFRVDRGETLVLCIEVQLGSQQTVGRPVYC